MNHILSKSDWDSLCNPWNLSQHTGLTPKKLTEWNRYLGSEILVIGNGKGIISSALQNQKRKVIAVDYSSKMVTSSYVNQNIRYIEADASSLPFSSNKFSSVILSSGILRNNLITQDEEILTEACRVLENKKFAVLSFPLLPKEGPLIELGIMQKKKLLGRRLSLLIKSIDCQSNATALIKKWNKSSLKKARILLFKHLDWIHSLNFVSMDFSSFEQPNHLLDLLFNRTFYSQSDIKTLCSLSEFKIKEIKPYPGLALVLVQKFKT